MAKNDKVCPTHGPYAPHASCPRCNNPGGRPKAPHPLDDEDEIKTDLGNGSFSGNYSDSSPDLDDEETVVPKDRRNRGQVDLDNDLTGFGSGGAKDDKTVLKGYDKKPQVVEIIFWQRNGKRRGKILQLKNQDTIGRAIDCNHSLDGDGVSGRHAKITLDASQYYIWDLGSANGTFVNGEQIYGRTPLKENDIIRIDDFEFVVKMLN